MINDKSMRYIDTSAKSISIKKSRDYNRSARKGFGKTTPKDL
jgi:hypothetical protein